MTDSRGPRGRARPADPRALLAVTVAIVVASLVSVRTPAAMIGLLAFVCVWHAVTTRSPGSTATRLRRIAPFAAVIVVLNAVFGPGPRILPVAGVFIFGRGGVENGVFFALRLALMLMSVSLLLAAVTPESMAGGLYRIVGRVWRPAGERAAFFVFLSMGFVPLVAEEFQRIRVAQAFRGGDFGGGMWRRVQSARSWLVPLLVSAVHRSGQLALAVELRDVRRRLPQTIVAPRARAADLILVATTALAIVAASR